MVSQRDAQVGGIGNPMVGISFCSKCGSTLCGTYKGEIHGITLGCVNGNPDVEVGQHIFVGSKAAWEVMPSGVRVFDEWPDDPEAISN